MVFWAVVIGVLAVGLFLAWRFDRRRNAEPHAIESSIAQTKGDLYNRPGGNAANTFPKM